MDETAFDPLRKLCPDGSCVGVIGPDGRCSVCSDDARAGTKDGGGRAAAETPETREVPRTRAGFDPTRRLCDDGTCVGVVGADGACGTCGRKAD